ncbi:HYR domain-containing protein [Pontibacter sp. MBLB2868]|uniref:HYR domain-containing protein n=1 Tax=Pontibacter sp. MBLB2868 TaxID=3451555 RepID=UPI003F755532
MILFYLSLGQSWGQTSGRWMPVGTAGFSAGSATHTSIALDPNGTPYVAYRDGGNSNRATVMKYDGTAWVTVGAAGFSLGEAWNISLAVDKNGKPYLAYTSGYNGSVSVMSYNGSEWEYVGSAGISAGGAQYTSLALDSKGIPLVAYTDFVHESRATVMKFNGSTWDVVGYPGFTTMNGDMSQTTYISLALDTNDIPYVAYASGFNWTRGYVSKFNGTNWETVNKNGPFGGTFSIYASASTSSHISLAVLNGIPYVAYRDQADGGKILIKKSNGNGWDKIGSSSAEGIYTSINLYKGAIYVAYQDGWLDQDAYMLRYGTSYWNIYGKLSEGGAGYTSLALDANGTPYVAYVDKSKGNRVTVMKVAGAPTITSQPLSKTITGGESISFTVEATGDGAFTYQWQVSKDGGATFSNVSNSLGYSGATSANLDIANAPISMNGYKYRVLVSNGTVSYTTAATLTVNVPAFDNTRAWTVTGVRGFSEGGVKFTSSAIDDNGVFYVAYRDESKAGKVSVMKFNGTNWIEVGSTGFSAGQVDYVSLALDASGLPYVAYRDYNNNFKATVMKFDGTNWSPIGTEGFSTGSATFNSLAIDASGVPFLAFRDGAVSYGATVMKFDGTSWKVVGVAGFSTPNVSYTSLSVDTNGMPYVAYRDEAKNGKVSVMRYNGTSWELVGSAGFSLSYVHNVIMDIDANGMPYVAYRDGGYAITVKKFDGKNWALVGPVGFANSVAYELSLKLDSSGVPFIAYRDEAKTGKVSVMKYNGTSWEQVGSAGLTAGAASSISLAIGKGNTPYVAFQDEAEGYRASVMRFVPLASSNADLSSLAVDLGTLTPVFVSGTTAYSASVVYPVASVKITPTVADAKATVQVNGSSATSGSAVSVPLTVGANTITVLVTAEDGTQKTYSVTVERAAASTNNNLTSLTLSAGTLFPAFDGGTVAYSVSVSNATASVAITPTVADGTATVTVNGTVAASRNASTVNLAIGANTVEVKVTAQDGSTKTYTLTIERAVPAPSIMAHPADVSVCPGSSTSFSVTANDAVSYQWQEYTTAWLDIADGGVYSGATTAELAISSTAGLHNRQYRVVVKGGSEPDAVSNAATLASEDAVLPVVTCTGDMALPADAGSCTAVVTVAKPTMSDNCGIATVVNSFNGTDDASGTYPVGVTQVTWTVTDKSGNVSTCSQKITVTDAQNPTITAPAAVTVNTDAGKATASNVTLGTPVTADNCSVAQVTNSAPSIFPLGNTTVTWTVTDGAGNTATATQLVTVKDAEAPVPAVASLPKATGECAVTVTPPRATDNVAGDVTASTTDPLTYASQGVFTINWTYSDGNGNTAAQTQQVEVKDVTAPVLASVAPITKNNDLDACGAVATYASPTATDNCGTVALEQTAGLASGSLFPVGTTTNTFVARDAAGNTSTNSFDVTVTDAQKPTVITRNITVALDASGAATITPAMVNNGSTDNCGIATVTLDKTTFNCANMGANSVTLTVTDASGNRQSSTATVTVEDKTAPVAKARDITVQLNASGNAVVTAADIDNGSTDACGIASLALDKTNFDCSNVGTNLVTLTVTDNNGNTSTATATVTVEDTTVPVAVVQNITVSLSAAGTVTITPDQVNNGSSDACGLKQMALDKVSLDCSNIGDNTVTLTVTDNNGNSASATATVTVIDNTAPVAAAKNITIALDAMGNATITAADINNGSSDACGIRSIALDKTSFTCSNVGANPVTLTVTDNNGNVSTATAIVTVEDKTAPTAIAKYITVNLGANGTVSISTSDVNNGSADNCGIATVSLDKTSFDCSNVGDNEVKLTVTDINGNAASATAIVTIKDETVPVALAQDITVSLDAASGTASITPEQVNNGSADNCSVATLMLDKTSFDCSNVGANLVTLTVTDASGNSSTATATVTVEDKTMPVAAAKNVMIQLDANGSAVITADDVNNGSSDNCGIASMTLDKSSFGCSDVGANTITLTVEDASGNKSTTTATVTVEDSAVPVALAKDLTVELDATGNASIIAAQVNNGSTDNCGIASLSLDKMSFECSNIGANTVTLTVEDASGNQSTATATITVVDKLAPAITAPAAVVANVDAGKGTASGVALGTPVTADNCGVADVANDAPAEFPAGTTTVTWTVTDASGNKATATQQVTVRPDVASVAQLATIKVPIRTAYANVPLPATVEVTYTNNEKQLLSVTWAQGTYDGFVAGSYELTGQLILASGTTNLNGRTAKVTVEVQPNKVPTALHFSATTFKPEAKAEEVIGTLTTTDPDDNQFVYTLVSGSGDTHNSLFEVVGDKVHLKSNNGLSGQTQFTFRVRSTDPYQNTIEKSFTLSKENYSKPEAQLKIVNAFSPDGDGINDTWFIPELRFYNEVEVEVFDRSGVRVFHTTNPEQGWDGKDMNGQVRQGAYVFIVQVKDTGMVRKGVVTILKK